MTQKTQKTQKSTVVVEQTAAKRLENNAYVAQLIAQSNTRAQREDLKACVSQVERLLESLKRAVERDEPSFVLGQAMSVALNVERAAERLAQAQDAALRIGGLYDDIKTALAEQSITHAESAANAAK